MKKDPVEIRSNEQETLKRHSQKSARIFPSWKGNLVVFGILVILVIAYFTWQIRLAKIAFIEHAEGFSRMLSGVIELNAKGTVLSGQIIEKITGTFLENTARFVAFLNSVEPFLPDELASFSKEAGLAGISIHSGGKIVDGPENWLKTTQIDLETSGKLIHLPDERLFYLTYCENGKDPCVIVGFTAEYIERLRDQTSLDHLLEILPKLPGIQYTKIEMSSRKNPDAHGIHFLEKNGSTVAESRIPFRDDLIIVGIETGPLFSRIGQLRREFFLFSFLLVFCGFFFSWLLHRYQNEHLKKIREYEREMAKRHEEAALGRAAASIAHEIRNPMNAISIGLQRLLLEADGLDEEYRGLIANMRKAVGRTDTIVRNIGRYASPLRPNKRHVFLSKTIEHVTALYRKPCEESGITCSFEIRNERPIQADPVLLEEMTENIVKNAVEAQPDGGWIRLKIDIGNEHVVFSMENGGFHLSPNESGRIVEPYFTTKTRGTGLGLAIAEKIIQAHEGSWNVSSPLDGVLRMEIYLPGVKTDENTRRG